MEITKGPIWKALLSFFFPILAGTLFQQLYNTVDAFVVGQYVGTAALAAVGGTTAVYINLLLGFFLGLSSGAGVLISQFYGANNKASLSQSVHTAIALSLVGGLIITLLGIACTNIMLILTHTPEDVVPLSRLYLTIIFSGTIPTFIYNMGSGILRAVGNSRTPLHIIIVGCVTNIALDLLFVRVLGMGVEGVAFATVICQLMSAVIVMFILLRTHEVYGVKIKDIHFSGHILREMLRIGFPAGIQSSLYTISNLIIQTKFNLFGTKTVAAWAAYGKIDAIFWMTVNAFGIAITTFAGQNAGAGQLSRIKKGMWQTLFMATVATVLFCLSFWFFGTVFFRLFSKEEEVITIGMQILKFMIPWWITYISIEVLSGTIRGTGNSFIPMMITVFGVCALRILWLFTAVRKNSTLNMVMASYPITWIITSIAFWIYYLSGKWIYRSDLLKKKPID
ncbi:MAG TPA: MATE family efflux transporter [Treponema sp.]|nr:MATE family efflux transporter [Treponema sp.]